MGRQKKLKMQLLLARRQSEVTPSKNFLNSSRKGGKCILERITIHKNCLINLSLIRSVSIPPMVSLRVSSDQKYQWSYLHLWS